MLRYAADAFGLHRLPFMSLSMPRLACWWQVLLLNFSAMMWQRHLGCNRLHLGLCPVSPMLWSRGVVVYIAAALLGLQLGVAQKYGTFYGICRVADSRQHSHGIFITDV